MIYSINCTFVKSSVLLTKKPCIPGSHIMAQSPRKRLSTTHVLWVALLCGLTACTSPKLIQNASDLTVPSTKALIKTQQNQTATHLSSWSIIGVIAAKQK